MGSDKILVRLGTGWKEWFGSELVGIGIEASFEVEEVAFGAQEFCRRLIRIQMHGSSMTDSSALAGRRRNAPFRSCDEANAWRRRRISRFQRRRTEGGRTDFPSSQSYFSPITLPPCPYIRCDEFPGGFHGSLAPTAADRCLSSFARRQINLALGQADREIYVREQSGEYAARPDDFSQLTTA